MPWLLMPELLSSFSNRCEKVVRLTKSDTPTRTVHVSYIRPCSSRTAPGGCASANEYCSLIFGTPVGLILKGRLATSLCHHRPTTTPAPLGTGNIRWGGTMRSSKPIHCLGERYAANSTWIAREKKIVDEAVPPTSSASKQPYVTPKSTCILPLSPTRV
jgi:hypothetical protein